MLTEKVGDMEYQEIKSLKQRFQRANVTDYQAVSNAIGQALYELEYRPDAIVLESLGDILDYVGENIEREALEKEIASRTVEEWRKLEYEYVNRADYTEPDLRDDVLTKLESGKITEEEAQAIYDKYRPCKHRFCLNFFEPKHGRQVYCDDTCKENEKYALREFARTSKLYTNGTYLPVFAYKNIRSKQAQENFEKSERLFEGETLQLIADEKELKFYEVNQPTTTTSKQNKFRREKQWLIDKEIERAENEGPAEVGTYNMYDLTINEIREKKLEKFLINRTCNVDFKGINMH